VLRISLVPRDEPRLPLSLIATKTARYPALSGHVVLWRSGKPLISSASPGCLYVECTDVEAAQTPLGPGAIQGCTSVRMQGNQRSGLLARLDDKHRVV
jgi:hypothetical protein